MDQYYKSQEFLDILALYENMRDNGAAGFLDAADYADVAEYYLAQGNDARAKEAARCGTEVFPTSLPPLAVLARIELSHGRISEAAEIIERAEDKDDLEYHYVQAELLIAKGDPAAADEYLSALDSEDDPDDIALDICAIFIDHNEFQLARKWLDKVKDRSKVDVQDFEAHILTAEGHFDEGMQKVNELLDENPYSTEHWNHLAGVQYQKGDFNSSIESSNFTLAIEPNNAEAILNKANAFYALKNYEKALGFYEQFLKLRPDNLVAHYYHGVTLMFLKRRQEALTVLKKALEMALRGCKKGDNTSEDYLVDIMHEVVFILDELHDLQQAQQLLDKAIRTIEHRRELDEDRAELYLCKAKVCFFQLDGNGAIDSLDQAQRAYNAPVTYVRMTAVIYECGFPDRAFTLLASQLLSETGQTWTTGHAYLALYAHALGEKEVFEKMVSLAVKLNPEEAQQVLGDYYPPGTLVKDYPTTTPISPEEINH